MAEGGSGVPGRCEPRTEGIVKLKNGGAGPGCGARGRSGLAG